MKLWALVFSVLALNSYAAEGLVLTGMEKVKVSCPKGNVATIKNNVLSCACPEGTLAEMEGSRLVCHKVCEITAEVVEGYEDNCDQGGCSAQKTHYKYKVMAVRVLGPGWNTPFYEKIYSPRQSEFDELLAQAKEVAAKTCYKTTFINKLK